MRPDVAEELFAGAPHPFRAGSGPCPPEAFLRLRLLVRRLERAVSPPVKDGVAYVGTTGGTMNAVRVSVIDAKDGRVLWRADVYGWAWPRPAAAGDTLFASAAGGSPYEIRHVGGLAALDVKTGAIRWRWPSPECPGSFLTGFTAPPVVEGDAVLVGGLDGSLYAFPAR